MNLREWHNWKYNNCDIKEGEEKKMKIILKELGLLAIGITFYFSLFWLALLLRW